MKIESQQEVMTKAQQELAELRAARLNKGNNSVALTSGPKDKITLCVDLSGSMGMNFFNISRAQAAKQAMNRIILASNSRETAYGLVSFTHEAYQVHPMGHPYAHFLTTQFQPTGGTNMYYGLQKTLTQNPTRVIVLSDGETPMQDNCLELARNAFVPKRIKIDTIAIGEADEQFLRNLSELTSGHFQRASNPEELNKVFTQLEPRNYLQLEHK